jgi:hypothetical protein
VRSLFAGLFDDAALFPPGDAPMAAAVPAHRHLRARLGDLVGPSSSRPPGLGELSAHLGRQDAGPFGVSLIAAAGDLPAAAARVDAHPGWSSPPSRCRSSRDATGAGRRSGC